MPIGRAGRGQGKEVIAMRSVRDLAGDALTSEKEHARRATTLRRLAGGLRAQSAGPLELDAKERKLLASAAALLEAMADASKKAAALAKKRAADRAAREKALRAAMRLNFAALVSTEDRIALIAAVQSYSLEGGPSRFADPRRLREVFDDAIEGLASSLARSDNTRTPAAAVAEAWAKFDRVRSLTSCAATMVAASSSPRRSTVGLPRPRSTRSVWRERQASVTLGRTTGRDRRQSP
jgi:hypothetical protein